MKIVLILVSFFLLDLSTATSQGFLRRSGKKIVNDNGEVLLKGMNLGNWLVQEGYMMGINKTGYLSPSDFRIAIKNLVGTEVAAENFISTWRDEYIKKGDIDSIASKGFNSVRVPFHYATFYDTVTNQLSSDGFKYMDSVLKWCEAKQLYVILDMHCAPGAQNSDYHSDSDGLARLWSNYAVNKPLTAKIWKWIAGRYASNEWLGGYDLLNEPVISKSSDYWKLRDVYVAITDSIRLVDTNHLIFAEGNFYATNLSVLSPAWDANMAYSIHNYWTTIPSSSITTQTQRAALDNLPIWLGESGENSNNWYNKQIQDLESRNIGWCWWSHKKINSITAPYTANILPGYRQILNYWNGTGAKPTSINAYNYLIEMATNTSIEKCSEKRDVLDALLRDNFSSVSIPFKIHSIPGKVYAIEYDMGGNGTAYEDDFCETTSQGTGWTDWNNGWNYRNDGVDIGYTNDQGGTYYIGWLNTAEWLSYSVAIAQSGKYKFAIRYATPYNGSKIQFAVDGVYITQVVTLQNSTGWDTWQTAIVENIDLSSGNHVLQLVADVGGFNLSYYIVSLQVPTAIDEKALSSDSQDFELYPIPAAKEVRMLYKSGNQLKIEGLELIDAFGRITQDNEYTVGYEKNEIILNIENLNSGIYYLKIIQDEIITIKKIIKI